MADRGKAIFSRVYRQTETDGRTQGHSIASSCGKDRPMITDLTSTANLTVPSTKRIQNNSSIVDNELLSADIRPINIIQIVLDLILRYKS